MSAPIVRRATYEAPAVEPKAEPVRDWVEVTPAYKVLVTALAVLSMVAGLVAGIAIGVQL